MKPSALLSIMTLVALCSADALAEGPARAVSERSTCLDAVAKGQTLRDEHKLVEARAQFLLCARAACPAVVQGDCANWVIELDRAVPTIVVSARDDAGKDVLDLEVSIDDKPLPRADVGQALPLDPGVHTFRFQRSDGAVVTTTSLIKAAERNQSVSVVFAARPPLTGLSMVAREGAKERTLHVLGLVAGSVGVAGLVAGIAVAYDAKARDNEAEVAPQPQRHTQSESAASEGNVATALLIAGAALIATGTVLWFTAPRGKPAVGWNGRDILLRGTF
jgi:hypothetical protein